MEKAIFFIGLGIFCAVIGLQLGLHNSDIRKLKKRGEINYDSNA